MIDYKKKYLKYKKKYLEAKKVYGGSNVWDALLTVVNKTLLEQNKKEFLNLYKEYLNKMTNTYFEEYHEEFIPIGLEISS